jgi:hypothetical protein
MAVSSDKGRGGESGCLPAHIVSRASKWQMINAGA